jgi:hypothetical protein
MSALDDALGGYYEDQAAAGDTRTDEEKALAESIGEQAKALAHSRLHGLGACECP